MNNLEQDVLAQIRAIALADVTGVVQVVDGQVELRPEQELTCQQRAAIASIERGSGGLKVKFYDKLKALELLGKSLGLFDRPPAVAKEEDDLLRAILDATKEVIPTHDITELQQAAAAGDDLVEPPGIS